MDTYESALNHLKEITIYEHAHRIAQDEYERGINNCIVEDYINSAKEELVTMYPDVNWTTLKYGLDIR